MKARVAFIDYFPTHYRRRLYEELGRRMDVDFYFFADQRERYWNRKIPLVDSGSFRRVELRRFRVADEAVMPGVARPILARRYQAVVKNLNGRLMLPLTYGSARVRHVPFVLWTGMWHHPTTPFHRFTRPLTEALYRDVGAIVVYGDHVKDFLIRTARVDAGKVFVAGQAVDSSLFSAVRPSDDTDAAEILYVGQFEERKGLRYLLEAMDQLKGMNAVDGQPVRLRLVGNGSQEEWLRARVANRGDIELVGYRSQQELPSELARSRCLVLPSITTDLDREPWGLVVNEAMHAGVPVVASDAVGAAAGGLVKDGHNGSVVRERDSTQLAQALHRLVLDPDRAARMGDAARADAERFTHARMADAFQAAIEHAMASGGRRH